MTIIGARQAWPERPGFGAPLNGRTQPAAFPAFVSTVRIQMRSPSWGQRPGLTLWQEDGKMTCRWYCTVHKLRFLLFPPLPSMARVATRVPGAASSFQDKPVSFLAYYDSLHGEDR